MDGSDSIYAFSMVGVGLRSGVILGLWSLALAQVVVKAGERRSTAEIPPDTHEDTLPHI